MLISFFSKNRLSFWKNRFFSIIEFGAGIWLCCGMCRAPSATRCPRRRSASCAGLSNLYSLLCTCELHCQPNGELQPACLPRRSGSHVWRDAENCDAAEDQLGCACLPQPYIPLSESLTAWWGDDAQVAGARRFLSLIVISEPSERLFNAPGLMYTNLMEPTADWDRRKICISHNIKFEWLKWTELGKPKRHLTYAYNFLGLL